MTLSISGNRFDLHGSFREADDILHFLIEAQHLDRISFGLKEKINVKVDLIDRLVHPDIVVIYCAE
ncbi:MAG: hypothetical protein REV35_01225 [Burkholderia sp.]|nr:hypothetical protein [Burkholderia sp.]